MLRNKSVRIYASALVSAVLSCLATPLSFAAGPPFNLPPSGDLNKLRTAVISTNKGDLFFEIFPEDAPWHVANFKYLADKGYYRNLSFHVYYPNYIIQGGAPIGHPGGGPGYSLPPEFNRHKHRLGTLGMARRADAVNPGRRSNGGQFHILLTEAPKMDGSYTVFGQLVKGEDVLEALRQGDIIREVKVFVRAP